MGGMRLSLIQAKNESAPLSEDEFFAELTKRNHHFIKPETQKSLREFKILIAGCGSTGGACIESLARAGVGNFVLADNGSYELNNLNRQHAFTDSLGMNKALFHARELKRINPFVRVDAFSEGVSPSNVDHLVPWADLIMDAVDVTTRSGFQMKLLLHERAKHYRKPVLTALDLGFCQYGRNYDYRKPGVKLLDGKYDQAKRAMHPMKALFSIVPLSAVPPQCLPLVRDLLDNEDVPASQLGCASDLLEAIIVPVVLRLVETGELVPGWNIDLGKLALPWDRRLADWIKSQALRFQIRSLLKKVA